jgi:hypothetical protein
MRIRVLVGALVALAAAALTCLQLVVLAMATSHPGLAGDVMIRQRVVAVVSSASVTLVVLASVFRRRMAARRRFAVMACACGSLAGGAALVWRDTRQWDPASLALTGLTVGLALVCVLVSAMPTR